MKPRVFIGSSTSSLDIAHAVQAGLHHYAEPVVWDQNVFQPGQWNLESLLRQLDKSDFAIFIFSPDDLVIMGNKRKSAVRDNVILEFGLFLGKLNRERVYALVPMGHADLHLPSDLNGIVFGEYDSQSSELAAAVGPFCYQVTQALKSLSEGAPGSRATTQVRSTEQVIEDVLDDIRTLVRKQLSTQYVGVFPDFLKSHVLPCMKEAKKELRIATNSASVAYFSDYDSFRDYRSLVEQKKADKVAIKMVLMSENRNREQDKLQFAQTPEEWELFVRDSQNAGFQERLKEFSERILKDIKCPQDFYDALIAAETQVRRAFIHKLGEDCVCEVDIPMPLNMWIADEKAAVFSIPAYAFNKTEYGFETREPNLVLALRAVWQLYKDNPS